MRNVNSILALLKREFLVTFRNLSDILICKERIEKFQKKIASKKEF